jgi:hypothetical protein
VTALVGIRCDGCDDAELIKETISQVSVGPVRDYAKENGWHKTRGTYTVDGRGPYGYARDICPTCWDAGKR